MLFNSFEFMLFFPIVVGVFFVVPRKVRYIWLLAASYYFYMSWNAKYSLLLAFSTFITWASGLAIGRLNQKGQILPTRKSKQRFNEQDVNKNNSSSVPHPHKHNGKNSLVPDIPNSQSSYSPESLSIKRTEHKRKLVVAFSLIINLGVLALFKYFDFIFDNINVTLAVFSVEPFEKPFDLLLPVGISFYTFQALSYTIDVYRNEVKPEKNLFKYALFVSFFPQLVAGPIERSKNLLIQVEHVSEFKLWNLDRVTRGAILMVWGYFLKMVIADRAAIFVNTVYDNYGIYGQSELILATILFGIQIMCDFAGYSTIAIGAAKIMGFELMENFNTPYFAQSIQDFWRRWHISLSTWFRDYLYFPLGGSRCSKAKHYRNIMIVFIVSGIWHGAAWGFIVWGFLHGIFQVMGIATKPFREHIWRKLRVRTEALSWRLGRMIFTFTLVMFAWIFFRAQSVGSGLRIVKRILTLFDPWVLFNGSIFDHGLSSLEFNVLIVALIALLLVDFVRYVKNKNLADFLMEQNMLFRWLVMIGLVLFVFVFGIYGPEFHASDFIYFQF